MTWRENILGMRYVALVIVLASLTVACSDSSKSTRPTGRATTIGQSTAPAPIGRETVSPMPVDQLPLGAPNCAPPSPLGTSSSGSPETKGTAIDGARLYGLVMGAGVPLGVGEEIKIVWRMSGRGPLSATATSPSGLDAPLTFGPEEHNGSTYDRPGDEWGTGYRFPEPGCWHLHLERDDTQAEVWFNITAT